MDRPNVIKNTIIRYEARGLGFVKVLTIRPVVINIYSNIPNRAIPKAVINAIFTTELISSLEILLIIIKTKK